MLPCELPGAMSKRTFRSPSSDSAAVATAPSRLAAAVDGQLRWRELPDGTVEVATLLDDGRLERRRVEPDGSTTPLSMSPPRSRLWARAICGLGLALFVGTPIYLSVTDPGGKGEHPFAIVTVLGAFALIALGAIASVNAQDLDNRLKKETGRRAGWSEPLNLAGWAPRSGAQLRKVQELADDREGVAFVRDVGARTIEVYTRARGRFEHHWIDDDGRAELVDSASVRGRFLLERGVEAACAALFLGGIGAAIAFREHRGIVVLAALTALAVAIVVGVVNAGSMSLERRVRTLRSAGAPWHEIRTWIEENDD